MLKRERIKRERTVFINITKDIRMAAKEQSKQAGKAVPPVSRGKQ
jgi:phage anti-repressor protein